MAEEGNGFDPSKHLTDLRGRDYLEVKWRIAWLRDVYPDATIVTELMEHDDKFALFSARVTIPTGGVATGWGSETVGDFGDFIEKAETKALGRALAALGYGTQFCGGELDEGSRIVDSPVQRRATGPGSYDAYREDATSKADGGAARHELRRMLTVHFGADEKARFDFMEKVEPAAIKGTGVDYSKVSAERCHEIIAILPSEPEGEGE